MATDSPPLEKCVLVLGVSGMVGRPLALDLQEAGWQVFGAARFSRPGTREALEAKGIRTIPFDVTGDDPAKLPEAKVVFLETWRPIPVPIRIWSRSSGTLVPVKPGIASWLTELTPAETFQLQRGANCKR